MKNYGNAIKAVAFEMMLDEKFGTGFGARKRAMLGLELQRRILNMYITGQRAIPDSVWHRLETMPDWDEEVDPLS